MEDLKQEQNIVFSHLLTLMFFAIEQKSISLETLSNFVLTVSRTATLRRTDSQSQPRTLHQYWIQEGVEASDLNGL